MHATPRAVYLPGVYLHGTKAELAIGDMLFPGRKSNFEDGRAMNHVYFTATLDAAVWGAELAAGQAMLDGLAALKRQGEAQIED